MLAPVAEGSGSLHIAEVIGACAAVAWALRILRSGQRPHALLALCGVFFSIGMAGTCAVQSTWPSSAARLQVTGRLLYVLEHGHGKNRSYTFEIGTVGGGTMGFRAAVTAPFFAQGELVTVDYLNENPKGEFPRAVGYKALTGPRAGESDSVDASWLGPWIGTPIWFAASVMFQSIAHMKKRQADNTDTDDGLNRTAIG